MSELPLRSGIFLLYCLQIEYNIMLNTPKNRKFYLRKEILKGEENDRKILLRLQNKFEPISKFRWKIKPGELYMNTMKIKN